MTKKGTKKIVIKAAIIVVLLAAFGILLKTSSDTRKEVPYDPAMLTARKYSMLKNWIPKNSNLVVVADIYRLSSIPVLKNLLEQGLFKGDDTSIKTIGALLGAETKIGMIVMSAAFGDAGTPVSFVVVAQGDFRELDFVESVKQQLSLENLSLSSSREGGVSLYTQAGTDSPFAFAIPDPSHLIVGTKEIMKTLISERKDKREFPLTTLDSPFFGFLNSSERIQKALPPQFASLTQALFWADENNSLQISVMCSTQEQAAGLKMFFSGMKALSMLQNESNKEAVEALGSIAIDGEGQAVRIGAPLDSLPVIMQTK